MEGIQAGEGACGDLTGRSADAVPSQSTRFIAAVVQGAFFIGGIGFFILGLFYSTGFNKKGVIAVIALGFISWGVGLASVELSTIVAIVGAFLGHKWTKEHNAMVEGEAPAV